MEGHGERTRKTETDREVEMDGEDEWEKKSVEIVTGAKDKKR